MRDLLKNLLPKTKDRRFSVRIATRSDLEKIASLDVTEYHNDSIAEEGLRDWYERYPLGIFVLEYHANDESKRVVGALGVWPVTASAFQGLAGGTLSEPELTRAHIEARVKNARFKYWYVGDIIVDDEFRKKKALDSPAMFILMEDGLRHWMANKSFDDELELCAIAETGHGVSFLEHFGFKPDGDRPKIYRRKVRRDELDGLYQQTVLRFRHRPWLHELGRRALRLCCEVVVAALVIFVTAKSPLAGWLNAHFKDGWLLPTIWIFGCIIVYFEVRTSEWRVGIVASALAPVVLKPFGMI